MNDRFWGNAYRLTTICVDGCENMVLTGRFYNLYLEKGENFQSLMQLLLRMDCLLNEMNFPQNYTTPRSFSRELPTERGPTVSPEIRKGAVATFEVRVIFRQHSSWQGSIAWVEGKQEENFRSVLELIQLMESALQEENGR